jgi:hypothetical protein
LPRLPQSQADEAFRLAKEGASLMQSKIDQLRAAIHDVVAN